MNIDLRSDTVTRPTPGMLDAMMQAKVGDDVFGDDPSVNELESMSASLFGMEAAVFCPTGTMTNQVAIQLHTRPGDEVICDRTAHIYCFEGGGIAYHSRSSVRPVDGDRGRISPNDILSNINPDNDHYPRTTLASIENTSNRGGGSCYTLDEMWAIHRVCGEHGLRLHLDGARIFNALEKCGNRPRELSGLFDTISFCLSKGLGAPAGSLLLGSHDLIRRARRIRKAMGGGMRQAGYLAAAGIYALNHHVTRLKEDHAKAATIASALVNLPYVESVLPAETNIVIFSLRSPEAADRLTGYLNGLEILCVKTGPASVRFVTHLDIREEMMEAILDALKNFRDAS